MFRQNLKGIVFTAMLCYLPLLIQGQTLTISEKFKEETLQVAEQWIRAWSGKVDIDHLMSLHHPQLQYYWRANPTSYEEFKNILPDIVGPGSEPWDGKLINPNITIIDENTSVIGFQMMGEEADYEAGKYAAVSLVVTRTENGLKIIHIHESGPK